MGRIFCIVIVLSLELFANPFIVAHRGGTADAPENTIAAIEFAIKNQSDVIWISVQLSKDKKMLLYRPSNLSSLSNKEGRVSEYTLSELNKIDVSHFWKKENIWNKQMLNIPSLEEVLKRFPKTHFFIDLKSPNADEYEQANILLEILKATKSLDRVRVYSTNDKYILALSDEIPKFITRGETRTKLAHISLAHQCDVQNQEGAYYGFELKREITISENYTLGKGVSHSVLTWDKEAMDCFKQNGGKIILFGINSKEDYNQALLLGADGVMVDSPKDTLDYKITH